MKFLKKAVSTLLAAVTAVTMMFAGNVSAGADYHDDNAFVYVTGYYLNNDTYQIDILGYMSVLYGLASKEFMNIKTSNLNLDEAPVYMAILSLDDIHIHIDIKWHVFDEYEGPAAYAAYGDPFISIGDDDTSHYDRETASSCMQSWTVQWNGKKLDEPLGAISIYLPKGSKIIDRLGSVKKVSLEEGIYSKTGENSYSSDKYYTWNDVTSFGFNDIKKNDQEINLKKTTLTAKRSGEKIKLSWKKVDGAEKYQIYYREKGESKYKRLATVSGSKTSYSTSKLDKSKTYQFKIRSYKESNGKKVYSKFSKVKTVASK